MGPATQCLQRPAVSDDRTAIRARLPGWATYQVIELPAASFELPPHAILRRPARERT